MEEYSIQQIQAVLNHRSFELRRLRQARRRKREVICS